MDDEVEAGLEAEVRDYQVRERMLVDSPRAHAMWNVMDGVKELRVPISGRDSEEFLNAVRFILGETDHKVARVMLTSLRCGFDLFFQLHGSMDALHAQLWKDAEVELGIREGGQ